MQPIEPPPPAGAAVTARRALIVEDHQLLAETLKLALGDRGLDCRVASSGEAGAIADEAASWRPDLVLLDLDLGDLDGLALVAPIQSCGARVLIVSATRDNARLAAAVALGAVGWISKTAPFEDLVQAAERAASGEPLASPATMQALRTIGQRRLEEDRALAAQARRLTQRERAVLAALSDGMTATDIADRLVVSVGTVRSHVRAIFRKLDVSSQITAVAVGRRILTPGDADLLRAETAWAAPAR